jgi:hypothetical protein
MLVTLELPEELAVRLNLFADKLPQIFELGLREFNAISQIDLTGAAELLEFLAKLPSPAEILALRPSKALQTEITLLLEKNHTVGLTPTEEQRWEQYQYLEHLVRLAKAQAYLKLNSTQPN